jgi:hypothetical protein
MELPVPEGELPPAKRCRERVPSRFRDTVVLPLAAGKGISSTNLSKSSMTTHSCKDPILLSISFQSDFFPSTLSICNSFMALQIALLITLAQPSAA